MGHLSAVEIVDLVEGRLAAARAAHVDSCADCRARVDSTREALAGAADLQVPEPSPLFWEHLSSRVREAIDREPPPAVAAGRLFLGLPAWAWAAGAALAMVVASAAIWRGSQPAVAPATQAAITRPPAGLLPAEPGHDIWNEDIESDQAWAVVRDVAEDIDWDDVSEAGITVRPQAAEHVVPQLSGDERSELARLIEDELRHSGA